MFKRMFASAVVAGGAAGFLAAALHFALLQDRILLAERYETGELTHFQTPEVQAPAAATDAGAVVADAGGEDHDHAAGEAHDHDHAAAGDGHDHSHAAQENALVRNGWTVLFEVLVHVAFAMLLVAGFGLAEAMGHRIGALEGLLWGLGGFAALQLAPALGLAPELPGTPAAPLGDRQLWWAMTALCTAGGLGLLAYGRKLPFVLAGVALLVAPHLIGAPELEGFGGVVPPELAGAFAARSLAIGALGWAFLGWLSGRLWAEQPA